MPYQSRAKVISTPAEIEITHGRNRYHFPPISHLHSLVAKFSDARITSPDLDSRYFHRPSLTSCLTRTVFQSPFLGNNHNFLFLWLWFFMLSLCFCGKPFPAFPQEIHGFPANPVSPDVKIPSSFACPAPCCHTFLVFFRKKMILGRKRRKIPPCPKHAGLPCETPGIYLVFKRVCFSVTWKCQNRGLWKESEIFFMFFLAIKNKGSTFALAFGNERRFSAEVHGTGAWKKEFFERFT